MTKVCDTCQEIHEKIARVLLQRGLLVPFGRGGTFLFAGVEWFAIEIPVNRTAKPEQFLSANLRNHLSIALGNRQTFIIEIESGIFIVTALNGKIHFSKDLQISRQVGMTLQIGRNISGNEIIAPWSGIGHILVGGMTGSGKSVFLRNLVTQAIYDQFDLFLVDADEMTFAALEGHGLLGAPIGNINSAEEILKAAVEEMIRRQTIMKSEFPTIDNYWRIDEKERENFSPMLVAIDEANGLISALGGTKGAFAEAVKQLVWRGRKFGVIVVAAGQTFEKSIVGGMRDQLSTKICFKVANRHVSQVILGRGGAEQLKVPGRAITNRWGLVQTYNVPPFQETFDGLNSASLVDQDDLKIIHQLINQFDGKMTFANLGKIGLSRTEAKDLRTRWEVMGLCSKDKNDRNSMKLSEKARGLVDGAN